MEVIEIENIRIYVKLKLPFGVVTMYIMHFVRIILLEDEINFEPKNKSYGVVKGCNLSTSITNEMNSLYP